MAHAETVRTTNYTDGQPRGREPSARWWADSDAGVALVTHGQRLWNDPDQVTRRSSHLRYARLFANQRLTSLYDHGTAKGMTDDAYLCWNAIQINVETAESKIAKNKPRVVIESIGGNWGLQRKARKMSKFLYGEFNRRDGLYDEAEKVFLDGAVFGTGIAKVSENNGRILPERILPDEVLVDPVEAKYGKPRSLIQRMWMHKDVAVALYADTAADRGRIWDAPGPSEADVVATPSATTSVRDLVVLYEGWHLPGANHKGKVWDPGRHVMALEGATLFEDGWDREYLPFLRFKWGHRLAGWWGRGIAESLIGLQLRLNDLNERIEQIERTMSKPVTWVKPGAKINYEDFTDDIGLIIEADEEPTFRVYNAVPDQLYNERRETWEKTFQISGNSEMSAAGVKPAGLNSQPSLREFHDIESARLISPAQRFERFFVEAAEMYIDLGRDIVKGGGELSVVSKLPGTKFLEEIKFEKDFMERHLYDVSASAVSMLPMTPAGKRQTLEEWWKMGLIDKAMFMSLIEMPDLEAASGLLNAGIDDIKATIERMVDDGKYDAPERYQNLALGLTLVQSAYLKAKRDGAPARNLDLCQRWLAEANFVMTNMPAANQNAAPAPAAAAPGMPPAVDPALAAMPPGMGAQIGNPALASDAPVMPPSAAPMGM